jgi:hypothetical protein
MQKPIRLLMMLVAVGLSASSALAQWTTQTIALRAGWNAVFLEIQPEPRDSDSLFAGLQVESVWRFNRTIGKVQFITDPDKMVPNQPDWLTWLPPSDPMAGNSRLHIIEGGRSYLIKRADNAAAVNWTIRGKPVNRAMEWLPDSLNLVGFPIESGSTATFQSFFTNDTALATNFIYRLNTAGMWVRVNNPATTRIAPGEAFWIRSSGPSDFSGTFSVDLARRAGISFGQALTEEKLVIRNTSTRAATFTLRNLNSDTPVSGNAALAGNVPLAYWKTDVTNNKIGWTNFLAQTQLISSNVPAGGEWELRFAVRRSGMDKYTPPLGVTNALYQTILEVSDGVMHVRVPVTAQGLQESSPAALSARRFAGGSTTTIDRTGLWVGTATFNKVSEPQDPTAPPNFTNTTATASSLQFRIIVHVDDSGVVRLLQKVLQCWQDGTLKSAGDVSTNFVVDQPGRYVLLSDEALAANYRGAALRDGQEVARRFSTAAFGFKKPILMARTGDFGAGSSTCNASVVVAYDDPLNPFVHRYHPDHDNLNDRFEPLRVWDDGRGPQTSESFSVTRQVELNFSSTDPNGLSLAGWGDNRIGGIYRETFTGLHRNPIVAEGTFQLFRVTPIGVIDP